MRHQGPRENRSRDPPQRVQGFDRLLVAVALAPEVDATEGEIGGLATEPPLG